MLQAMMSDANRRVIVLETENSMISNAPRLDKWDLIAREIHIMVCSGIGADPACLAEVLRQELGGSPQ